MYDGLLDVALARLEKSVQAFYWAGWQDGAQTMGLICVLAWLVSFYWGRR